MPGEPLLIEILHEELRRRPGATPNDLRKLVMQSVLGGDHLLRDPEQFERGLLAEWKGLPQGDSAEHPIQIIDPEGRTARIHLIPCRNRGASVEEITEMLLDQRLKAGAAEGAHDLWVAVIALAAQGAIPFEPSDLEVVSFGGAMHHSESYGFTSYRILNDLADARTFRHLERLGLLP